MNKNKLLALMSGIREPADKAGLIQKIAGAIQHADDPELRWAALGLLSYLRNKGPSVDVCLGLKPRQGGRHKTPWALSQSTRRDGMIVDLARLLPGALTTKCKTLSGWIKAGGPPLTVDRIVADKCRVLLQAFPDTPKCARQLARILNGETVSAQVTKNPGMTSYVHY